MQVNPEIWGLFVTKANSWKPLTTNKKSFALNIRGIPDQHFWITVLEQRCKRRFYDPIYN